MSQGNNNPPVKTIVAICIAVVSLAFLFMSFVQIEAGERGVVLRFGAYDRILGEGFHFVLPVADQVKVMNVQVRKIEVNVSAASKDLQTVSSVVALNYHVIPEGAGWLYQNVGREYEFQIVAPAIQEAVKAGAAEFTAEQLVSQRPLVKEAIKEELTERLAKFQLFVDDFSIVNFDFSEEFNASIEAKQVAEQRALQAENDLRRIEIEAKQKVEQAKAEAEAIRIQAEAITQQGGADYVNLKAIEKWSGNLPVYMLGDGTLPFINIPNN